MSKITEENSSQLTELLNALEKDHDDTRIQLGIMFNPHFGSAFRTNNNQV